MTDREKKQREILRELVVMSFNRANEENVLAELQNQALAELEIYRKSKVPKKKVCPRDHSNPAEKHYDCEECLGAKIYNQAIQDMEKSFNA